MPSKTIVSIVCITILLAIALLKGIDGYALAAGVAVIGGLGGFVAGKITHK